MRSPRDLANRMRRQKDARADGFTRETLTLPHEAARAKAREFLDRFSAGGTKFCKFRPIYNCFYFQNATHAIDRFTIPPRSLIEIGRRIEI